MQVLAVLPREPEIYLPRIGHHFWSEKTRHSQSPLFDVVCYLDLFSCRQVLINTLLTSLKKKLHCSFHLFCFALVCPVHRVIVLILSVQPAFAQAAAGPASSLKKKQLQCSQNETRERSLQILQEKTLQHVATKTSRVQPMRSRDMQVSTSRHTNGHTGPHENLFQQHVI